MKQVKELRVLGQTFQPTFPDVTRAIELADQNHLPRIVVIYEDGQDEVDHDIPAGLLGSGDWNTILDAVHYFCDELEIDTENWEGDDERLGY